MELVKYDELVWLEAIIKTASERRDILKGDCKDELLESYEADGTTQKRSKLFGKEASVMSVTFSKPKEAVETVTYSLADWTGFAGWLSANRQAAEQFCFANAAQFAEWWVCQEGELPDGIAPERHVTEAVPEKVTGVRLSVKPEKVFESLGVSFEDGIRGLLPGDAA